MELLANLPSVLAGEGVSGIVRNVETPKDARDTRFLRQRLDEFVGQTKQNWLALR
jgi:hypothetical protein